MKEFFSLNFTHTTKAVKVMHVSRFDLPHVCLEISTEYKLSRGEEIKVDFPVLFKQTGGQIFGDILFTGPLFLISDNLKNVLAKNDLTGWKTFPVKVLDKKGKEVRGYHGLSITGKCGPINFDESQLIQKRFSKKSPLRTYFKGISFVTTTWDGKDFFLAENYFAILVSEKAAKMFENSTLTHTHLENIKEIEFSAHSVLIHQQSKALKDP